MVTVLLGAIVSLGIAAVALSVIFREFHGRWAQVVDALAFDQHALVGGGFRPVASRQPLRAAARVRHHPSRRAAA